MKTIQNLLLLLSITFVFPLLANSQIAYHHYLDSTSTWYEVSVSNIFSNPSCLSGGSFTTKRSLHVIGVEYLDGDWWYKIHEDGQGSQYCPSGSSYVNPPYSSPTFRYIREDSSGKIWKHDGPGDNIVLYDFGQPVNVGNEIWMNDSIANCSIQSIDTVFFGNQARARYWCACDSNAQQGLDPGYVIEGVGYSGGFDVGYGPCYLIFDNSHRMICAGFQGDTILLDSIYACDGLPHVIVGVEGLLENDLQVWWDETVELIRVRSSRPLKNANWRVYDLHGRTLAQGDRISDQISVPSLLAGMYLFVLKDDSRMKVLRFLKRQ